MTEVNVEQWGQIAEKIVVRNPLVVARRLREELKPLKELNSITLRDALNRCAQNIHEANRLARSAKLEAERVERSVNADLQVFYQDARQNIQKKGVISQKDIEGYILENYQDQYSEFVEKQNRYKMVQRSFESLEEAWKERSRHLQSLVKFVGNNEL